MLPPPDGRRGSLDLLRGFAMPVDDDYRARRPGHEELAYGPEQATRSLGADPGCPRRPWPPPRRHRGAPGRPRRTPPDERSLRPRHRLQSAPVGHRGPSWPRTRDPHQTAERRCRRPRLGTGDARRVPHPAWLDECGPRRAPMPDAALAASDPSTPTTMRSGCSLPLASSSMSLSSLVPRWSRVDVPRGSSILAIGYLMPSRHGIPPRHPLISLVSLAAEPR